MTTLREYWVHRPWWPDPCGGIPEPDCDPDREWGDVGVYETHSDNRPTCACGSLMERVVARDPHEAATLWARYPQDNCSHHGESILPGWREDVLCRVLCPSGTVRMIRVTMQAPAVTYMSEEVLG